MLKKAVTAIAATLVFFASASCGGGPGGVVEEARDASPIVGEAQEALPRATLVDWVTYGDKLVLVKVTSEDEGALSAEELERGEGFVARLVTIESQKDQWTRFGVQRTTPTSIELANGGWVVHGDARQELQIFGQTKVEPGHEYLALLSYTDVTAFVDPQTRNVTPGEGAGWTVLDMIPVEGGKVGPVGVDEATEFPARAQIAALDVAAVGARLGEVRPDPAASLYMRLDPVVRFQYVLLDQHIAGTPAQAER